MKTVTIQNREKESFVKEPVVRALLWYDNLKKELLEFKGTNLDFEYKQDPYILSMSEEEKIKKNIKSTYRLLPKPILIDVVNYKKKESKNNNSNIKEFFNSYLNYNDSEISIESDSKNSIVFNVPDKELSDFVYEAERIGLDYNIE